MNKEETEIKKIEIEIKEIEQRIREKKIYNPFLKFLFTVIIGGVVLFASWVGIYKELLFVKNTIATEDARLAHLITQQLQIENEMKVQVLAEQTKKLDNALRVFKDQNTSYLKDIKKLQSENNGSSLKSDEYQNNINRANETIGDIDEQRMNLRYSGTMWNLEIDGNSSIITLLANGRIYGFGKFNDYWEVNKNELILYTGADDGKASWTRKWVSTSINSDIVSGKVVDKSDKNLYEWKMTRKSEGQ